MILTIIIIPLLGSLISGLLGHRIGYKVSGILTTTLIIISALLSYILYYNVMIKNKVYGVIIGDWLDIEIINIPWGFIIDELAISLLVPVCTISGLVHLYAISYMSHDPHQQRFFSILSLFTGFMIVLVTGNNYLILFLGWELIGVASYLLIGHWYTRLNAVKSALSAFLMNKVGDMFITIGMFIMLVTFGSLNYSTIFSLTSYINSDILNLIMICLLIGTTAKSAQLGLHHWLLNSMEGPTPVSALLHAACLVCAGIYLLLRSSFILEYTPTILLIILWLGGITTLVAGIIAIVSNDIKKIIALSTMSQLGLMIVAIGLSAYNVSLYHLFTHSVFKALLFMCAGSIIHSVLSESQDIRTYGGLIHYLPLTYIAMLVASLSLMAYPGLSGFYSKDIIIESSYSIYTISGFIIYWFTIISATLTSIYSLRLIYFTFFKIPNNSKFNYLHIHESSWIMLIPMILLTFLSIILGYLTKDIYLGLGKSLNSLFIHPNNFNFIETEFSISTSYKLLPLILSLFFITILLIFYENNKSDLTIYNNKFLYTLYLYFNNKFMLDQILNNLILRYALIMSQYSSHFIDNGLLQIIGPTGSSNLLNTLSYNLISNYNSISLTISNSIFNSNINNIYLRKYTLIIISTLLTLFLYLFNIINIYILILLIIITII